MEISDIVIFEGEVGIVVRDYDDRNILRFLPAAYGSYYSSDLKAITPETVEPASFEQKIKYIKKDFSWGKIIEVHTVADYQIIAFVRDGKILFHPFINFKSISCSYESIEAALIGVIAYRFDGANSQAAGYFNKMIGI